MRFIAALIALLLAAAMTYYYLTGSWPGMSKDPLKDASRKAAIEGGPITDPQMAKERVEGMLKKSEEAQRKDIEDSTQ